MTPLDEFRRGEHTRARGRTAEDDGARWLERRGYRILERNVRFKTGELDVVALDGRTLCFVEIKARQTAAFGSALDALTARKRRQVSRTARLYLASRPHVGECRFDVLAMDGEEGGWEYTLIRGAFELE